MLRRPTTATRALAPPGAALLVVLAAVTLGPDAALLLLPALLLGTLVVLGWLPGEERILRAVGRRLRSRRVAGPPPALRRRAPRRRDGRGLDRWDARSSRGPPPAVA